MWTTISIQDKKHFIKWFLHHYELKINECHWILTYVMDDEHLLSNTHFVREVHVCPRGMSISSLCSKVKPFAYHKGGVVTHDTEKSFHDVRLNKHEPLYIQLNFKKANQNSHYVLVLEENPYIPEQTERKKEYELHANELMDQTLFRYQYDVLNKRIDQSLDDKDQKEFIRLTNRRHVLKEKHSHFYKI